MRTLIMHSFTSFVGVILLLDAGMCGEKDADPMMAAESGSYFDLLRARQSQVSTHLSPTTNHNHKPVITYSEPEEIYKKEASEYWNNELPGGHQGEAVEEDYGGYDQQPQQQSHGYLSPQGGYMKGKEISVTPDHKPITLHYRTHSQPIMVHQTRIPGPKPEVKYTKSHEDPHRVVHEVVRPIIQEVHEIIQPYRRVVQQVQPVIEEVRTVVAKDAGKGIRGQGEGQISYGPVGRGGGQTYGESKLVYQKALMYEAQPSPSETRNTMTFPPGVLGRSKVFFNRKGVPVYQSNYLGPAFVRN